MDKPKKTKEKVSTVPYITIDYSFFDHPKTRALRIQFKSFGPYVLQLIWRQMYLRNSGLDDGQEFNLLSLSEDAGADLKTIKDIIEKCLDLGLLTRDKKTKLLYSEEALRRMKVRLGDQEFYRLMGAKGAEKRWGSNREGNSPPIQETKPPHSPLIANKKVSKGLPLRVNLLPTVVESYPLAVIPTTVHERSALLGGLLSARGLMLAPENKQEQESFYDYARDFCNSPLFPEAVKFVRDYNEAKAKSYVKEKGLDEFLKAVTKKLAKTQAV